MTIAIKIENVSKQYRLGLITTRTLSHDLNRLYKIKILGKEDPYLKIDTINDPSGKIIGEYVWALKNINFEVEQGEVLGIIGKNGAGKSTLLKILSKVTAPTTGTLKVRGRYSSLLEVGTGFHPEMTGRENIYMNGAILGMRKREITQKINEIIDFAGIDNYVDTPVKRYSSGMTVRLGFAVAAYLEPEILIVDEVLSIGDIEFQKRALGKMKQISKTDGRTVLFVSHNMNSILNLCTKGILLENGISSGIRDIKTTVDNYYSTIANDKDKFLYKGRYGNKKIEFLDYKLLDVKGNKSHTYFMGDDILINISIKFHIDITYVDIGINVNNNIGEKITHVANYDNDFIIKSEAGSTKEYIINLRNVYFSPGQYYLDLAIVTKTKSYDVIEGCLPFSIVEGERIRRGMFPPHIKVFTKSNWEEIDK